MDDGLDAAIVAGARARRALGKARSAWHAAISARGRLASDPMVRLRCTRCGLRIIGLPHARAVVGTRATIHARACPGGERGLEVWAPLVHRLDVSQGARPEPALRLIRGARH